MTKKPHKNAGETAPHKTDAAKPQAPGVPRYGATDAQQAGKRAAAKGKSRLSLPEADPGMLVATFTGMCLGAVIVAGWISLQEMKHQKEAVAEDPALVAQAPPRRAPPALRQTTEPDAPVFAILPYRAPTPLPAPSTQQAPVVTPSPEAAPLVSPPEPLATPSLVPNPYQAPSPVPAPSPSPDMREKAQTALEKLPVDLYPLRSLLEANNPEAAHDLGMHYLTGTMIPRDYKLAAHWLNVAAKAGIGNGAYNLGMMQLAGLGIARDEHAALASFRHGADLGDGKSMHNLAILLLRDGLDTRDRATREADALALLRRAQQAGHGPSALPAAMLMAGKDISKQDRILWLEAARKQPADQYQAEAELAQLGWRHMPLDQQRLAVMQLQLAKLGFDPGPADGKPGSQTYEALNGFMIAHDLPANPALTGPLLDRLKAEPLPASEANNP